MALRLLDQPDDWTEPGAHAVVDHVYRIPLPLPLEGLEAVNVYLIEDPDGLVLIDAGWAMPATEKALADALSVLGHKLADIDQILVTHAHWDHYTQALALRDSMGTRVRIGRGEQRSIEEFDLSNGSFPRQARLLRMCGAPALADWVDAKPAEEHEVGVPFGPPDSWLDDGEEVVLADRRLDVLATPGHTRGHVVIGDSSAGLLFSGDHVLPHITPSLGLERSPQRSPLRSFLDSLRLVRNLPDALLLPAHGPVTRSVHTRVDELLAHHDERLEAVCRQVRAGADTAYAVARALPWTRRQRKLDDLGLIHQMMAVLEIDAHLDVLAVRRELIRLDADEVRRFVPLGEAA